MTAPGWPRMMRRATAALYCDLTAAEFEREVAATRLPSPVKLGNSEHWSRVAIDECLNRLTNDTTPNWRSKSKLYNDAA
jgi:predicted DNA-binding transcriptional regulator AlpA